MADGADTAGSSHAHSDVALRPDVRLGRVRPIRTNRSALCGRRPPGKRTLYFSGGQYGISDAFEGDEEGVALSVDLPALALGECRPQYLAVLVECVAYGRPASSRVRSIARCR